MDDRISMEMAAVMQNQLLANYMWNMNQRCGVYQRMQPTSYQAGLLGGFSMLGGLSPYPGVFSSGGLATSPPSLTSPSDSLAGLFGTLSSSKESHIPVKDISIDALLKHDTLNASPSAKEDRQDQSEQAQLNSVREAAAIQDAYDILVHKPDHPHIMKNVMSGGMAGMLCVIETEPRVLSLPSHERVMQLNADGSLTAR